MEFMSNENITEYLPIVQFGEAYNLLHPYLAIPICIFTVFTNILNSVILSSKYLLSATNCLLLFTAVCHLGINIIHLSSLVHDLLPFSITCDSHIYTYEWTSAMLLSSNLSFTLHVLATWLTVALAIVRCVQLKTRNNRYSHHAMAKKIGIFITIGASILCIPNYLAFSVKKIPEEMIEFLCVSENVHGNSTEGWLVAASDLSSKYNETPLTIAFELSAILFFLIPCLLLIVAFCYLMSTLIKFGERRKRLGKYFQTHSCVHVEHHTALLLVILVVFVTTQLPQGILTFLCSVLSQNYQQNVYQSLSQFMELLSIINGLIGFIVNCAMSTLFRSTFVEYFCFWKISNRPEKSYSSVDNVRPNECQQCRHSLGADILSSVPKIYRRKSSDALPNEESNVHVCIYFDEGPGEIV